MLTACGQGSPSIIRRRPRLPARSTPTRRAKSRCWPRPAATPRLDLSFWVMPSTGRRKGQAAEVKNKGAFLWRKFPKFVLGFLLISLLATVGFFTKPQLAAVGNLSRWAFLLTFAGVGLRTNLRELSKQGARPFIVGAVGEIVIALITLGLVFGADHWYHL